MLTAAQVLDLLNQVFLRRVERDKELNDPRHLQPIYSPFTPVFETIKAATARPGLLFVALLVALLIFWLVV